MLGVVEGKTPETCKECGFDSRDWRVHDAHTLFGSLGYWWRLATADILPSDLNRRPSSGVWSALEYGLHTSMVTAVIRAGIEMILERDGCALPAPPPAGSAELADVLELDVDEMLANLEREGDALAALTARDHAAWENVGHLPDSSVVQAKAILFHAAHDASHHFMDVGRGLAAIESGTPRGKGTVTRVNVSDGGVPKHSVAEGVVGWRGLDGDRQADRKHHGRPFQALCLWSAEVIAELTIAGHPIAAGSAGENLTLSGVDWDSLRPGVHLMVGTALVELSYPAVPCKKQTRWFNDGDFTRISHDRNPHWARWYGWVRQPGRVQAGDAVVVQP
jgi:MOSC domain-containing protein YiiM